MSLPKPMGDRVLLRPWVAPTTTESGLVVVTEPGPDVMGTVVRLGVGPCTRGLSHGDTVLFPPTAGQELTIDGERLLMVPAEDILAILEED